MSSSRGLLIVFEGADRCGKSTQCIKLLERLIKRGINTKFFKFPDRTTIIGKMIDSYLTNKENNDLNDQVIHLLFAANRREALPKMTKLLNEGITLVVDRYSFSGVAYSAAKSNISFDWCIYPEIGLLEPDLVIYLESKMAHNREGYGNERYENKDFQKKVCQNYKLLFDDTWRVFDADKTIDEIHDMIWDCIQPNLLQEVRNPLKELWMQNLPTQNNKKIINFVQPKN